ncbi:MAG: phytase [Pseudomonadota bacterium]
MLRFSGFAASLLSLAACASQPETLMFEIAQVRPSVETTPMVGLGDQADDPAIWVNPLDAERSLVLGTNKDTGLYVYDLAGKELQFLPVGRVNNVDVRFQLAVASNDETNGLSWFRIEAETAEVVHIGDSPIARIEPYGVCAGMLDGLYTAGVTYKDGTLELWSVPENRAGDVSPFLARTVSLDTQLEGCVFDDASQRLFIGEEERGIWTLDLSDESSAPILIDSVGSETGLASDVEGLTIWNRGSGNGFLVASAQGKNRYVVYDLAPPHAPRGVFEIVGSPNGEIDGTSNTDGIDATATPLPGYSKGLLVVQDDANPSKSRDQNFKYISWEAIERALSLENE